MTNNVFKNKSFNLAFLISISWHLFFLFFVAVVVLPESFEMAKTTTVSFLGPILERTAFDLMLNKKAVKKETFFEQPQYSKGDFLAYAGVQADKVGFDSLFSGIRTRDSGISANDLFGSAKVVPSLQDDNLDAVQEKVNQGSQHQFGQQDFSIEGPIADRDILSRPEIPYVPKTIEGGQGAFVVELRFEVAPEGDVSDVSLLASSGYPQIDLIAMDYIKAFKFSSVSQDTNNKPARGKIRLHLKSK